MSYGRFGDPIDDFNAHDAEQEALLEKLPVCDNRRCRKKITDDMYFEVEGDILCEQCMRDRYGRSVEDWLDQY